MYPLGVQYVSATPSGGAPVTNETVRYSPTVASIGQTDFPLPVAAQEVLSFCIGGLDKDNGTEFTVLGSPGALVVRWNDIGYQLDPDDDIEILYKT